MTLELFKDSLKGIKGKFYEDCCSKEQMRDFSNAKNDIDENSRKIKRLA